jgi:ribonuclease HI
MSDKPHAVLYTDGSCPGAGTGAWACLAITSGGRYKSLFGYSSHTTINRCELQPVIDGLLWARELLGVGCRILLCTDSEHVAKIIGGVYRESANLDLWAAYRAAADGLLVTAVWRERQSLPGMRYADALCWSVRKLLLPVVDKVEKEDLSRIITVEELF